MTTMKQTTCFPFVGGREGQVVRPDIDPGSAHRRLFPDEILRDGDEFLCQASMTPYYQDSAVTIYPAKRMSLPVGVHTFGHPTEKPLTLFSWCVQQAGDVHTILDPFAGSGTTGRAAKDLGRKAVLIEREERYCEIAAKRMAQEVFDFSTPVSEIGAPSSDKNS
jgi:hypothetical protein